MQKFLKTFEIWASFWPEHADFWPGINDGTKYVMSRITKGAALRHVPKRYRPFKMNYLARLFRYGIRTAFLIFVLCIGLFIWRAFYFQHDEVNFNYDLQLTSPNQICHLNDSITLIVSMIAQNDDRTLRLFNDNSNMQIHVRKADQQKGSTSSKPDAGK